MAKTQSMSLNPTKISGSCGRLMCCLRYEQDAYEELVKTIPKNGAFVQTTEGYGNVVQTNVLRQKVRVRLDKGGEAEVKSFDADEVAAIPGGRPKPGDPMPDVLVYVEKPKESAAPMRTWKLRPFAPDEPVHEKPTQRDSEEGEVKRNPRSRNRPHHNGPKKPGSHQPERIISSPQPGATSPQAHPTRAQRSPASIQVPRAAATTIPPQPNNRPSRQASAPGFPDSRIKYSGPIFFNIGPGCFYCRSNTLAP